MDTKYDIDKMKNDFPKEHSMEKKVQTNENARRMQDSEALAEMLEALQYANEIVRPRPATEEDHKRFSAFDCIGEAEPTGDQLRELQLSGRRILASQLNSENENHENTAKTAEKLLFLSGFDELRWISAKGLMIAHSRQGLTEINQRTNVRTLERALGYVPEETERLRAKRDALPEIGSRKSRTKFLILALLAITVAALVQFLPAISALFTEDNVSSCLMAVGVIATIVFFFVAGFGGAAVFLVIYAVIVALVQWVMPLAVFGKIFILLLLVLLAIYAFRRSCDHHRRTQPAYLQRREEEIAALRAATIKCRAYEKKLSERVEAVLRESEEREKSAAESGEPWDEKEKEFNTDIREYITLYRKKIDNMVWELEKSLLGL